VSEQGARPATDGAAPQAEDARALVAHALVGLAELTLDGVFTRVNPYLCALVGYGEADLLTRSFHAITHPDDRAHCAAQFRQAVASGEPFVMDKRYVRPDGTVVWVSDSVSVLRDATGQPERVVMVVMDITARKRAEAALAERARLLDLSNDAIIVRDADDRIIYWNHGATELYGWTPDDAVGQHLHTFLRTEFEAPYAQLLTTLHQQDRMEGEVVQVTRDGRRITVACRWALDRDAAGNPGAILTTYNDITERKRAEAALRESEARFRLMADAVPQIVWLTDADGRVEFFNKQWRDYTGAPYDPTTAAEVAANFVHPDDAAQTMQAFTAARRDGSTLTVEHRIRSAASTYRWFLVRAEPYRDPHTGAISRWFGASIDIHDRKQAEAALRHSEERLRVVIESAHDHAIFTLTPDNRIDSWNIGAERIFGYTEDEIIGQSGALLFTPDDRARGEADNDIATALGTGRADDERWHVRKDGSRFFASGVLHPLREAAGSGFVKILRDLTERKQVEDALRASEERLRLVIESVQDYAIFTLDPAGRVTSWNAGAHRLKGYTTEEIVGQPVERFYIAEDVAAGKPAHEMDTALRDGRSEDESWRVRQDGTRLWVNEIMTPLYAADGTHLGFAKISRDLTARKQAENDRACALAAAQAAQADAEAALKTRDQFLSIASHELRTPLTSLLGYASLLPQAAARGTGKVEQMTERIVRQAQRLNGLIDQLLDVSRLQQGQFAIVRRPLDLAAVVGQVVDEVRATLPPNGTHFVVVTTPHEPVMVDGDVERLEQVLHNLLSNAIKYSPQGGTVRVRVAHTATDAIVAVMDQGIGIPQAAQIRLFEPFYRAPNVGGQASGFGLGLHIVREIVVRHGGRIEVDSTEGIGSTFRIVLPVQDTKAAREAGGSPPA